MAPLKRSPRHAYLMPLLLPLLLGGCSGAAGTKVSADAEKELMCVGKVEITAFLGEGLSHPEIEAIASDLNDDPGVARIEYTSEEDAVEEFMEEYPEIYGSLPAGAVPGHFAIEPAEGSDLRRSVARLNEIDGVYQAQPGLGAFGDGPPGCTPNP